MRILCLYNNDCAIRLFQWLESQGNEYIYWKDKIEIEWLRNLEIHLAVSYTYSRLIKLDVIQLLKGNIVNIHNSYLPFNRGSDPNLWSLVEDSPRGVSLHYIDEKLDRGFIIEQVLLDKPDYDTETLKTTYNELDDAAFKMFKRAFRNYKYWKDMKKTVLGTGSYHSDKDGEQLRAHIESYDMTVSDFMKRIRLTYEKEDVN